jgi:hypothetical protein
MTLTTNRRYGTKACDRRDWHENEDEMNTTGTNMTKRHENRITDSNEDDKEDKRKGRQSLTQNDEITNKKRQHTRLQVLNPLIGKDYL